MKTEESIPQIIRLAETRSTNSYLRSLLAERRLPEGSVAVAHAQTAGRGQLGNAWESEPGKNLTFSLVIYPDVLEANRQFLISQIAALSVKETLERYTDGITVKWPNDIYWRDRKICGMLIENDLAGRFIASSILGIGINLNQDTFRSDAPNPVSLRQITGRDYDLDAVLEQFLSAFYAQYLLLLQEEHHAEIQSAYRRALYRGEGFFPYRDEGGTFEARIHGVEPSGHLLLQRRDGSISRYAFKEVSVLLP